MKKLKKLWLSGNQITNLAPLAGLKELRELHLEDNPSLTEEEVNKLKRALPRKFFGGAKCKIYYNISQPPVPPKNIPNKLKLLAGGAQT